MITIQDTTTTLPAIAGDDYEAFFRQEHIKFMNGNMWKKIESSFWQEMRLHVSPNDGEELKRFLRSKREAILNGFESEEFFVFWKRCFDNERKHFDEAKFVRILVAAYDNQIDRSELDKFFSWFCLTMLIEEIINKVLRNEQSSNATTINFFYNDGGDIHFGNNTKQKDEPVVEEEPLRNIIFNTRLFDSNDRLAKLRITIAAAIDMGDATIMYGQPQQVRINPDVQSDWYYIVKAIEEAKVAGKFTITGFIEQMVEWFPMLFPDETKEQWEKFKRRLSKSISDEKSLWRYGKMKEIVTLREMWAKRKNVRLDQAKMERVYAIAYQGLYVPLAALKQEIERENNTEFKE